MKAHSASLLNAIVLLICSAWAWFGSDTPSNTAFIPAAFAAVLLICYPGVRKENKLAAHLAALVTLLLLFALIMPLRGALGREDMIAVTRVSLMMASTAFALFYFIKAFIDIRRRRAAG